MPKKILEYKKFKKYYIGATHDPNKRLDAHIKELKMYKMILLCQVPTKKKTISLEKKLILKKNKMMMNQSGSGEGITEEVNYIYLLLKR